MTWLLENWDKVWVQVAQVIAVASIIVKLTPSDWDNNLLSKLIQLLALTKKVPPVEK